MAEQTTSSIVVDAPPAAVMAVIADFAAYPEWAQGMKRPRSSRRDRRPRGAGALRARGHARSRTPTRWPTTGTATAVTWTLVEGKMLKAMEGAYVLRAAGPAPRSPTGWRST